MIRIPKSYIIKGIYIYIYIYNLNKLHIFSNFYINKIVIIIKASNKKVYFQLTIIKNSKFIKLKHTLNSYNK
jgi:hypothetical protein